MCGIVGWVKQNSNLCASNLVKTMADTLAHRGQDDQGFFCAAGVCLGHRRLSIIDLQHGHQPMVTRDGRYVIIYNGEVYNFHLIRNELKKMGEIFTTNSDTEVILKAFCVWGTDIFKKLQGMFAIAIWDKRSRTLHLVRDHLGIKPLYYADLNGELIFASEIKALFCHPEIKRRMNPLIAANFLAFNNNFSDDSFWMGVKRCNPGERLEWQGGRLSSYRFFDIGNLEVEPFNGNFKEAANKYKEILSASVEDHLISDVPVGAYLSSGIDSGSVVTLAAKNYKNPMHVFTGYFEGFENGWYDERCGARTIAEKNGLNYHECVITCDDFINKLEKVAYHLDEPALGSGAIPQFIVASHAHDKIKVVLTGHGGDELFTGYPVFKAVFMKECGVNWESLKCLFSGSREEKIKALYFLLGGLVNPIVLRGQFRMSSMGTLRKIISGSLINEIMKIGGVDTLYKRSQPFTVKPTIDGVTRWYIGTYLPTLLLQEDKISMAFGIEGRVPLCYEPLIKFSLSLSSRLKLNNGELKAIPREGMHSILPDMLYSLPKRGFPTPIVSWLTGKLGHVWEKSWKDPLPASLEGLLNPQGICREFLQFRTWGSRLPNAYAVAHRLVSLQMLLACGKSLLKIPVVKNFALSDEEMKKLPGVLSLA